MDFTIRAATVADASKLLQIYAPYVENTAISFEYEVPSIEEFAKRIENIMEKYPYLVAIKNGDILGYCYVGPFKTRAAYDYSVETTLYLSDAAKGQGIGRALYEKLEQVLKAQNILTMDSCIAYANEDDPHLTNGSVYFHEKLGYKKVAHFPKSGYKFGKWYDMIWMEKEIGEHIDNPPQIKTFNEIRQKVGL